MFFFLFLQLKVPLGLLSSHRFHSLCLCFVFVVILLHRCHLARLQESVDCRGGDPELRRGFFSRGGGGGRGCGTALRRRGRRERQEGLERRGVEPLMLLLLL